MTTQRYVTPELIHFVGRRKRSSEGRYRVLKAILRSGWLAHDPSQPGRPQEMDIWPGTKLSEGKMFKRKAVCFCDIPIDDLQLHMDKYSRFGVSFLKTFLIKQGTSPAFYFANDSTVRTWRRDEAGRFRQSGSRRRGNLLDEIALELFSLWYDRRVWREGLRDPRHPPVHLLPQNLPTPVADHLRASMRVDDFLMHYFLGYIKGFRARHPEEHRKNYYMEREWRAIQDVKFRLRDVWRVIVPRDFAARFRSDFPNYDGQTTFS